MQTLDAGAHVDVICCVDVLIFDGAPQPLDEDNVEISAYRGFASGSYHE